MVAGHREADTLLIVVTDGKIAWDTQSGDFDWQQTTCLPAALKGFEREEPLYVDIRWAKRRGLPPFRDPRSREAMPMLLAAITGRAKDEIDSEDIRQQRRLRFTAVAAGLLITVLAIGAIYGGLTAAKNRLAAESSHRESESRRLAEAALAVMEENDGMDRAITLGVLAWRVARPPEAESALQKLQRTTSDVARVLGQHTGEIKHMAFSGDGLVLATAAEDGSGVLWRVSDWRPTGTVLPGERDSTGMALDWTGSRLLVLELVRNSDEDRYEHKPVLWDVGAKTHQVLPKDFSGKDISNDNAPLSPDGKFAAFRKDSWQGLVVWDITARNWSRQIALPRVEAFRFIDNTTLIFLSYSDHARRGRCDSRVEGIRVGKWDILTGAVKLGAYLETLKIEDIVDYTEQTFSGDGSKLYWPNQDKPLWAVQPDLMLSPVRPPDRMPAGTRDVVFDYKGEQLLTTGGSTRNRAVVWDLSRNQVLKLLSEEPGHGGLTATLSPDGRWLAAVHGSRDAPVVVWDLNRSDTSDPASSLRAVCNLEETECILRMCEKISRAIDEPQLRELVGDDAFDEVNSTIRAARCGE